MHERLKVLTAQFLAERHTLMAFLLGLLRDPAAAEEIFQEVWLRLAEAAESGQPIERIGPWCRGVAKNLILQRWRERRLGKVLFDQELIERTERAFDEQDGLGTYWVRRREALGRCLEGVPEDSRMLLRLRYEQGLPLAQVAKHSGRSLDGITMALSRLRKNLADCVNRRLNAEERK